MRVFTFSFCFVFAVLAASLQSYSQVEQSWVQRFDQTESDRAVAVKTHNSNIYVLANTGIGNAEDVVLIKYNAAGQTLWTQSYNSPSNTGDAAFYNHSMAVDGAGNVFIVGNTQLNSTSSIYNIFVVKYGPSGTQEWVATYSPALGARGYAVAVDASGNVYACGQVGTGSTFTDLDYVVIKFNSLGVQQWIRTFDGSDHSSDIAKFIALDATGNVFVSGESLGRGRKGQVTFSTGLDIVTIKFNSSGKQLWVKSFSDRFNDLPHDLLVDASGNIYVTGESESPADPNTNFLTDEDWVTIKYNPGGVQQWLARFSGASGPEWSLPQDMAVDGTGNVYVTGVSQTTSAIDGLTIKYSASGISQWQMRYANMNSGTLLGFNNIGLDGIGGVYVSGTAHENGNTNFKTVKYSASSGFQSWAATYDGPVNGNDQVTAMAVFTPPGPAFENASIYVTGTSAQVAGTDVATIRYSQPIVISPDASVVEEVAPNQFKLSNYPNPFAGGTRIVYQLPFDSYVSIKLYDITGKELSTIVDGRRSAGIHTEFFNIDRLSKGSYTYRMITNSSAGRIVQTRIMVAQ